MDGTTAPNTDEAPAKQRWGGISGVILSSLAVGIILTGLAPLLTLNLERAGFASSWIGVMGATPAFAVICMSAAIPLIIKRLGAGQSMAAAIILASTALLLFPLFDPGPWWFVLRFIMALGIGITLVVSQTWAIALSTPQLRGTVMGLTITAISVGFAVGPLLVGWLGSESAFPFIVIAAIMAASIVAVPLAMRNGAPGLRDHATMRLRDAFRRAPHVMMIVLLVGFIWITIMALLPVYGVRSGLAEDSAVFLLTCFVGGNVVFQYPIGRLLDRWDAKRFLVICSLAQFLGVIGMALTIHSGVMVWAVLALWGGFLAGSYTAAITMIGRAFQTAELSGANSAASLILEVGGLAGPLLAGFAIQIWGLPGMIAILALAGSAMIYVAVRPWAELAMPDQPMRSH